MRLGSGPSSYLWWDYRVEIDDEVEYAVVPVLGSYSPDEMKLAEELASATSAALKVSGQDLSALPFSDRFRARSSARPAVPRLLVYRIGTQPHGSSPEDSRGQTTDPTRR